MEENMMRIGELRDAHRVRDLYHQTRMEEVLSSLLASTSSSLPDLLFHCSGGVVPSHLSLLTLLSPIIAATTSPSTSPSTSSSSVTSISLPHVRVEAMETLLGLYTMRWGEVVVAREVLDLATMLLIPLKVENVEKRWERNVIKEEKGEELEMEEGENEEEGKEVEKENKEIEKENEEMDEENEEMENEEMENEDED